MFARKWGKPVKHTDGSAWQYYIETKFAFLPVYANGTLLWIRRYWVTWPVDEKGNAQPYRTLLSSYPTGLSH